MSTKLFLFFMILGKVLFAAASINLKVEKINERAGTAEVLLVAHNTVVYLELEDRTEFMLLELKRFYFADFRGKNLSVTRRNVVVISVPILKGAEGDGYKQRFIISKIVFQ